ncbi:hypothetical protein E1B28_009671 [Marasmius oreades]|uniref:Uncharacterized protein n=1 Tax=Marasmius oreades TaxID=181124 RepID=A0A9P7RW61_9AGAR|nr:uncharacterized protein E1B28_009671 [Marasmius oreades]KAG7090563.1 hypothetical protein E1B28_009671 [Marasmius oreades]
MLGINGAVDFVKACVGLFTARLELPLEPTEITRAIKAFKQMNAVLKNLPTKTGKKKRRGSGTGRPQEEDKCPHRDGGGAAFDNGEQDHKTDVACREYRSRSGGYSDGEEDLTFGWENESSSSLEMLCVGTTIQLLRPIAEALNDIKVKPGQVVLVRDCDEVLAVAKLTNTREVRILRELQMYSGVARIIAEKKLQGRHLLVT